VIQGGAINTSFPADFAKENTFPNDKSPDDLANQSPGQGLLTRFSGVRFGHRTATSEIAALLPFSLAENLAQC
jgi:hypothetical protein